MQATDDPVTPVRSADLRAAMARLPTGVSIVTTTVDEAPVGFLVGSFTSISLEPPLVGFFADKTSRTLPQITRAQAFCVNFLGHGESNLCRRFADKSAERFAGLEWSRSGTGSPVLAQASTWIDCDLYRTVGLGDHFLVVGRVRDLGVTRDCAPLVFHAGRLTSVLESG